MWLFTQLYIINTFSLLAAGSSPSESPVPQSPDTCVFYVSTLTSLFHCPSHIKSKAVQFAESRVYTHDLFINLCSMANTVLSPWPFGLSRILSSLPQQGISF